MSVITGSDARRRFGRSGSTRSVASGTALTAAPCAGNVWDAAGLRCGAYDVGSKRLATRNSLVGGLGRDPSGRCSGGRIGRRLRELHTSLLGREISSYAATAAENPASGRTGGHEGVALAGSLGAEVLRDREHRGGHWSGGTAWTGGTRRSTRTTWATRTAGPARTTGAARTGRAGRPGGPVGPAGPGGPPGASGASGSGGTAGPATTAGPARSGPAGRARRTARPACAARTTGTGGSDTLCDHCHACGSARPTGS